MEKSEYKVVMDGLREQWKELWTTRFDDKVRAEGIARKDYPELFVERGTVIIATRKFKPLNFHEILQQHLPSGVADVVNPSSSSGGYRKFIKEVISRLKREGKSWLSLPTTKLLKNPPKKKRRWAWLY